MDIMEHLDFDLWLNFWNEEYNEEIEDEIPNIEHQKIVVQHWDIFQLWNHILMCWDSSNQEDVQKLMNKKQADMIFTDPPYNVNYKWGWKKTGTNRKIENDHMSTQNFQIMLNQWFKRYQEVTKKEAWVYVFHSTSTQIQFQQALEENGFEIKNQLIWNKPSAALWWWDYRWKHEPFFYCTQKDSKTNFYGDRTNATVIPTLENKTEKQLLNILKRAKEAEKEWKTTLWSIKRENVNEYLHPTQKPIELIEYALKNSSKSWDIVLDLFWGSWSTLIAAEKTQRICYMMELDPSFIQVMLQRYHDVTNGSKPIKCMNRDLDFSFLEN
jgi:DNA modification methylase